jgi:hypothetical protein
MEKNITVHVVKTKDHEFVAETKAKARYALEVLQFFGVDAEMVSEKRKATLSAHQNQNDE